jgi:hypothetical protein
MILEYCHKQQIQDQTANPVSRHEIVYTTLGVDLLKGEYGESLPLLPLLLTWVLPLPRHFTIFIQP